jgi:pimeloyl-ACP methyl ester carboxylesterase
MRPAHRFVTANGLRLHALDFGGQGRPVVLLHGVTGHGWTFSGVVPYLSDHDLRPHAVDLRGHGDSQWSPTASYATADAARDIIELIGVLGDPVDLVGSSWGGLVALAVGRALPSAVRRIVVLDAPPSTERRADDVRAKPESFDSHLDILEWERGQHPNTSDSLVELLASHGYRPTGGGRLAHKYDPVFQRHWAFRDEDHRPFLPDTPQPTLVVRGARSPAWVEDAAIEMADLLPDGRLITLPDVGHLPELDDPHAVGQLVADFLRP